MINLRSVSFDICANGPEPALCLSPARAHRFLILRQAFRGDGQSNPLIPSYSGINLISAYQSDLNDVHHGIEVPFSAQLFLGDGPPMHRPMVSVILLI
jgi:hypothetical protein